LPVLQQPATAMKLGGVMLVFAPSSIVTGKACARADRMSTQTNMLSSRPCGDRHGIEYEAVLQPIRGSARFNAACLDRSLPNDQPHIPDSLSVKLCPFPRGIAERRFVARKLGRSDFVSPLAGSAQVQQRGQNNSP
jgi:hypothetical protein